MDDLRKLDARVGRVGNQSGRHRRRHDLSEDPRSQDDSAGFEATGGEPSHPRSDSRVVDLGKPHLSEFRNEVSLHIAIVPNECRGSEIAHPGAPLLRPVLEQEPTGGGVDVGPCQFGMAHRGEELLGFDFAGEGLRARAPLRVAVTRSPVAVRLLRDR